MGLDWGTRIRCQRHVGVHVIWTGMPIAEAARAWGCLQGTGKCSFFLCKWKGVLKLMSSDEWDLSFFFCVGKFNIKPHDFKVKIHSRQM